MAASEDTTVVKSADSGVIRGVAVARRGRYLRRWAIRSRGRVVLVPIEKTDWIMAVENYVRIHSGADTWLLRAQIGDLAQRLDPDQFVRVHRSAIVRIDRIRELIVTRSGWSVVLEGGTVVRCGRGYHRELSQLMSGSL